MRLFYFLALENMSFLTYNKICNFMVGSYGVKLSGVHRQDKSCREFIKFLARAALEINIKDAFLENCTVHYYSLLTDGSTFNSLEFESVIVKYSFFGKVKMGFAGVRVPKSTCAEDIHTCIGEVLEERLGFTLEKRKKHEVEVVTDGAPTMTSMHGFIKDFVNIEYNDIIDPSHKNNLCFRDSFESNKVNKKCFRLLVAI